MRPEIDGGKPGQLPPEEPLGNLPRKLNPEEEAGLGTVRLGTVLGNSWQQVGVEQGAGSLESTSKKIRHLAGTLPLKIVGTTIWKRREVVLKGDSFCDRAPLHHIEVKLRQE